MQVSQFVVQKRYSTTYLSRHITMTLRDSFRMDLVPRSQACPNHHGPNYCSCLPLQVHQHLQRRHPPAALPPHSLNPAATVIHIPASQMSALAI